MVDERVDERGTLGFFIGRFLLCECGLPPPPLLSSTFEAFPVMLRAISFNSIPGEDLKLKSLSRYLRPEL